MLVLAVLDPVVLFRIAASTQHYQPLWLLHSVRVRLRITQCFPLGILRFLDLACGAMTDEDRFPSPLDYDLHAYLSPKIDSSVLICQFLRFFLPGSPLDPIRPLPVQGHLLRLTCLPKNLLRTS